MRLEDPAFDYDAQKTGYASRRRTDERIARYVHEALGTAATIINVGAGAGSYEPANRYVVAVEPSANMRQQRLTAGKVPAINAKAADLPFDDDAFDAAMAMVTVHHWPDVAQGLHEVRRVTRGPVVIMTFDPAALTEFWNAEYFPELVAVEQSRYPAIHDITTALGGHCTVQPIPIPADCTDGFQEAFFARPEAFLEAEVRKTQSAWGFLQPGVEDALVQRLAAALASGEWEQRHGHHRSMATFTGALRLVVSQP